MLIQCYSSAFETDCLDEPVFSGVAELLFGEEEVGELWGGAFALEELLVELEEEAV